MNVSGSSGSPPCPSCGQEAPIVYRGIVPHCTACGAVRAPLSGPSVNLAGGPSRVGGAVASVLGWLVLVFGGAVTLGVVLLMLALDWTMGALVVGGPLGLVTLAVGLALVRGGKSLSTSAAASSQSTHAQALLALAAHRGAVTAGDAARALNLPVAEADALLTDLAKREPDRVAMDVDDQGRVWYRVAPAPGEPIPRLRVDASGAAQGPGVRLAADDELAEGEVEGRQGARGAR